MKRAIVGRTSLAAAGASALAALSLTGPATAAASCTRVAKNPLVPHLTSPCNGATVKRGGNITFTAVDNDGERVRYRPFILITASHKRSKGHLIAPPSIGDYANLRQVKGHPSRWTYTSKHMIYARWWDNRPGTYYVQLQQIDDRAGAGQTFYSPIVTIHVR